MESKSLLEKKSTTSRESKSKTFLQSVIGGVVAAGLVAAWLIVYLKPILSEKYEDLKNNIQVLKISKERYGLNTANAELKQKQAEPSDEVNTLQENYNDLQVQYASLENDQKKSLVKNIRTR